MMLNQQAEDWVRSLGPCLNFADQSKVILFEGPVMHASMGVSKLLQVMVTN